MSSMNHQTQGILELHPKGYGFLRNPAKNYIAQPADAYVPALMINKLHLREGVQLAGPAEAAKRGSGPRLAQVQKIEGREPEQYRRRNFDDLTPIDPHERIIEARAAMADDDIGIRVIGLEDVAEAVVEHGIASCIAHPRLNRTRTRLTGAQPSRGRVAYVCQRGSPRACIGDALTT